MFREENKAMDDEIDLCGGSYKLVPRNKVSCRERSGRVGC
jgi:hypothetical protein